MPLALAGLVLAWAAMLLFGGMELDRALLILGYASDHPNLANAARFASAFGDFTFVMPLAVIGALILLYRREWRGAVALPLIVLSGRILVELQKNWTARIRPDVNEHLVAVQNLSFPSGHAANATMVFVSLAVLLPRGERTRAAAIWVAALAALLVGVSRVMLGVHWPSDVIAGWTFGLFWTVLLLRLAGHRAAS